MSQGFTARTGVLPKAQRRLWLELGPAADLGFALYGGTAVALRLGHRQSADFDFFSERPLDKKALRSSFGFMVTSIYLQDEQNSLTVLVTDPGSPPVADQAYVKVSFFGSIGFGRVGEPEWTSDGVAQVASFDDLMATKVKVVLQRAEAKDYRDIAAMIQGGVSLPKGLSSARLMFGPNFQPSESLKALVYYKDGDLQTLSLTDRSVLIRAVSTVRDLAHSEIISEQLTVASSAPRPA